MSKYIDAEKLKKEIEKQIKSSESCPFIEAEFGADIRREGKIQTYNEILSLITSLQQEQPKQKKNCNDCPHCVDRKDQNGWHFKGCFGGPYKGKVYC